MIAYDEFRDKVQDWLDQKSDDPNRNLYDLRLGQYLFNYFGPAMCDPEVFYEEDWKIAWEKFYNKYVEK